MRYTYCILMVFLFYSGTLFGQSNGFLYLESDPSRPFYLRTRDSIYHSASENYLIVAPLSSLKGEILIGLPGMPPVFSFNLKDTGMALGFIIRDLKEEGWRLYDFQKNELVNIRRLGRQANDLAGYYKRTDEFALRLSQVVNDSIILFELPAGRQVIPVQKSEKSVTLPPVRMLSKMDLGDHWLLQFETRDSLELDTIRVEIDKAVKPLKNRKGAARTISESSIVGLFSQHEQVFYRNKLSRYTICRVPETT